MSTAVRRGDRVRIRGQHWHVTACSDALVDVRGCDTQNRGTCATFVFMVEQVERVPPAAVQVVRPGTWRRTACRVLADAHPSPSALRTAARARLDVLPFQLEPVLAWTRGEGVRFLIADEVGLGKTVQTGLLASELLARSPGARVLIVTPAGLREQWRDELRARFDIPAAIIDAAALAQASSAVLTGANPWTTQVVSIASIDFVKRAEVARALEPVVWDLVVFDEAHALAGHSDRALAASLLADRARTLVLVSATPHSGDTEAFERLVSLGGLEPRAPLLVFRRTRADAGISSDRRAIWTRVRLTPAERTMHLTLAAYTRAIRAARGRVDPGARLAGLVLTRRACSSAAALRLSVERRMHLLAGSSPFGIPQLALPFADDPTTEDAALAIPGLDDPAQERKLLERLLVVSANAARDESKVRALRRLLRRTAEPAIVFTEYRDTLEQLAGHLAGYAPSQLHGALSAAERRGVLRQFTHGGSRLLLATDAASEGLNLHHRCRLVINLELPWSPVRLEQRIGRVDRLGQSRRVHAVHLVARDTPEERLIGRLTARAARAEAAMRPPLPRVAPPAATEEAGRIALARVFAHRAGACTAERAVVTNTRRHQQRSTLAYRVFVTGGGDELIWDTVIGLTATGFDRDGGPRSRLGAIAHAAAPLLERAARQVAVTAATESRAAIRIAVAREHAIRLALQARRSRMARQLVQTGLFDARTERAATARARVLEDALASCDRELQRLNRRASAGASQIELAFALLA